MPDHEPSKTPDLRSDIERAINRHSAERGSDTPDFILAEYLTDCLAAFDKAVKARGVWYSPPDPDARPRDPK